MLALIAAATTTTFAAETASDSENVDIVISSDGVLSVVVEESKVFPDVDYSFDEQVKDGELTVTVTDLRGTAAGWTFNLRANGNFEGANTTDSFPVSGLELTFDSVTPISGNSDTTGIVGSGIPGVSTTGQEIVDADQGYGNGEYDLLYLGALTIPGDTLVDTYTTTLIVEVASAPS